jgi:hypothetical protein
VRIFCVVGQTLERRNVELLILSVTFLKKLSIYRENKDKMHECGLVARLAHFVPVPNEVLLNAVLRLLVRGPADLSYRSASWLSVGWKWRCGVLNTHHGAASAIPDQALRLRNPRLGGQ